MLVTHPGNKSPHEEIRVDHKGRSVIAKVDHNGDLAILVLGEIDIKSTGNELVITLPKK
jgi:hypothetical protein